MGKQKTSEQKSVYDETCSLYSNHDGICENFETDFSPNYINSRARSIILKKGMLFYKPSLSEDTAGVRVIGSNKMELLCKARSEAPRGKASLVTQALIDLQKTCDCFISNKDFIEKRDNLVKSNQLG